MKKYSYTIITDEITSAEKYYKKYFGWEAELKSDTFFSLDTKSPLKFSVIEKEYLLNNLGIKEEDIPVKSFCTWIYNSEEELLSEKEEFLSKGLVQIGAIGHFLKDKTGVIWELRKKGDLI